MSTPSQTEFASISDYRRHIMACAAYSYNQYGHIFAPSPLHDREQAQARSRLDGYMRHLYLMALGAAMLQLEVQGNREIDIAISSGEIYQREGIRATLVQTETFSYYSTDSEAVGKQEWLPFLLEETYVGRDGKVRQKQNQKALNLAYKKPLEGEVVAEVHQRFSRWLEPVLDLFRNHWEGRVCVEGQMVMRLYFEYVASVDAAWEKYPGEENAQVRHAQVTKLRVQLLKDIEEVRQTSPERRYTDWEIIAAARRAIHNFCVDQNRRLRELLGSKRFVKMFLEGGVEPQYVYHTNKDPNSWTSPMLDEQALVQMLQRACLTLVESDQRRSKWRMDQKASETYAPVSHAETLKARGQIQEVEEHGLPDEEDEEELPFGLSWGSDDADSEEPEPLHGLTLVDVMATQGALRPSFQLADLKQLPYATLSLRGDKAEVIHRFPSLQEAAHSLRTALAQVKEEDATERFQQQVRLLHDPKALLGAEGSTRLLRTLDAEFQSQIEHQGDRYWCEWALVKLSVAGQEPNQPEIVQVITRYPQPELAGLALKESLETIKAQTKPEEFRQVAPKLKLVHDPMGMLGTTSTKRSRAGLPGELETQLAATHYRVTRGQIVLQVGHLKPEHGSAIADVITAHIAQTKQKAKAVAELA